LRRLSSKTRPYKQSRARWNLSYVRRRGGRRIGHIVHKGATNSFFQLH